MIPKLDGIKTLPSSWVKQNNLTKAFITVDSAGKNQNVKGDHEQMVLVNALIALIALTEIHIWNHCTSDKSDVKSISKYIQVYDGIYFIYLHILVYTSISK